MNDNGAVAYVQPYLVAYVRAIKARKEFGNPAPLLGEASAKYEAALNVEMQAAAALLLSIEDAAEMF